MRENKSAVTYFVKYKFIRKKFLWIKRHFIHSKGYPLYLYTLKIFFAILKLFLSKETFQVLNELIFFFSKHQDSLTKWYVFHLQDRIFLLIQKVCNYKNTEKYRENSWGPDQSDGTYIREYGVACMNLCTHRYVRANTESRS